MKRYALTIVLSALLALSARAQEADETADDSAAEAAPRAAATPDQPRAMSGMSILGNEEAPKALVIVPWKSSELGDELGLSENLDDRAVPVDKDVFLRKLRFYEIRTNDPN